MAGLINTIEKVLGFGGEEWPLPKFCFSVKIAGLIELEAQSVEGMEMEAAVIDYRHGEMPFAHKIKMPGMVSYNNVTIKKAVYKDEELLWAWVQSLDLNVVLRLPVIVSMLDNNGLPLYIWQLIGAFPVKFVATDLNAEDDSDPAIEELELAYEYMVRIAMPSL